MMTGGLNLRSWTNTQGSLWMRSFDDASVIASSLVIEIDELSLILKAQDGLGRVV